VLWMTSGRAKQYILRASGESVGVIKMKRANVKTNPKRSGAVQTAVVGRVHLHVMDLKRLHQQAAVLGLSIVRSTEFHSRFDYKN